LDDLYTFERFEKIAGRNQNIIPAGNKSGIASKRIIGGSNLRAKDFAS
jgi:hypothetical protein